MRHLTRQQLPGPSWVGWGLVAWSGVAGLMLVPSPAVGVIPGLLIVAAAREHPVVPVLRSRARQPEMNRVNEVSTKIAWV